MDFQSIALPTELPDHLRYFAEGLANFTQTLFTQTPRQPSGRDDGTNLSMTLACPMGIQPAFTPEVSFCHDWDCHFSGPICQSDGTIDL
jgi:hypothetical protein